MRMNTFAGEIIANLFKPLEELPQESYQKEAFTHSFHLLLENDILPDKEQIQHRYEEEGIQFEDYSYATLEESFSMWSTEFANFPGHLEIFRKNKTILHKSRQLAEESGIEISDIYLMFDMVGKPSGYFHANMAYLLDSYGWEDGSFPGEPLSTWKKTMPTIGVSRMIDQKAAPPDFIQICFMIHITGICRSSIQTSGEPGLLSSMQPSMILTVLSITIP